MFILQDAMPSLNAVGRGLILPHLIVPDLADSPLGTLTHWEKWIEEQAGCKPRWRAGRGISLKSL